MDLDETLIHETSALSSRYDFNFKLKLPKSKKIKTVYVQTHLYLEYIPDMANGLKQFFLQVLSLTKLALTDIENIDFTGNTARL